MVRLSVSQHCSGRISDVLVDALVAQRNEYAADSRLSKMQIVICKVSAGILLLLPTSDDDGSNSQLLTKITPNERIGMRNRAHNRGPLSSRFTKPHCRIHFFIDCGPTVSTSLKVLLFCAVFVVASAMVGPPPSSLRVVL